MGVLKSSFGLSGKKHFGVDFSLFPHLITTSKLLLEPQAGPKAAQFTLGHNGDAVSQDVSLLHRVSGQHNGTTGFGLLDNVPAVKRGMEREPSGKRTWMGALG